jgi:hypothetical protein
MSPMRGDALACSPVQIFPAWHCAKSKAVPARAIGTEALAVACIIQLAAFVIEGQVRVCDSSVGEDTGIDPDLTESAA